MVSAGIKLQAFVLLIVGVAFARHISFHDDAAADAPIPTRADEHRICADLCSSGLGGAVCGEGCIDVGPQTFPRRTRQSINATGGGVTRSRVCPTLCANRLGNPLCGCDYAAARYDPAFAVDFYAVCTVFCREYNYRLYGCRSCDVYNNSSTSFGASVAADKKDVDWVLWCKQMCHEGDGGAACYCDLLPMKFK